MKLKNTLPVNSDLIPFIDHEKTYENVKEYLEFIQTILTTSEFYEIKKIDIYEISKVKFTTLIKTKTANKSEKYVYRLFEVIDKVFNIDEKIYFYYHYILGLSKQDLRYGLNEDLVIISNTSRLDKQIIKKLMFSIQEIIEYKNMLIEEE